MLFFLLAGKVCHVESVVVVVVVDVDDFVVVAVVVVVFGFTFEFLQIFSYGTRFVFGQKYSNYLLTHSGVHHFSFVALKTKLAWSNV